MMSGLIDVIIILFLVMGALIGFKRGVFKSAVMFLGTILVLVLSFYLKNPISKLMYTYLPFFSFGGVFEGVQAFNIMLYEALAFFLVYFVLMAILRILIKVTGIFEKILKFTIILGIPSKILGAIFGLFEEYVMLFLILFLLARFNVTAPYINESGLAQKILSDSPILSNLTSDYYTSFEEIYSLKEKYKESQDKEAYNEEAIRILLKYQIITKEAVDDLVHRGKLTYQG